jgi:hypothetical protein
MPPYKIRLFREAWKEFKGFWSAYRNWVTVVGLLLSPAVIHGFRTGWKNMTDLNEGVTNGLIGLIVSLCGTALIAFWRGAKSLDAGLQKRVETSAPSDMPDLKGRAFNFEIDGKYGRGFNGDKWGAHAEIRFQIEVCNHHAVTTNIAAIAISGSRIDETLMFANTRLSGPPVALERGIRHELAVKAEAAMGRPTPPIKGEWPEEVKINLGTLVVTLVDGFGESHLLVVDKNETITF